jgi:PKD repeat protein
MGRLRALTPALAGAIGLLVGASSASATTFCINSPPGCVGTTALTIGGALSSAAASPGTDTIEVDGSNTYDESGLVDAGNNPVDIVGVGSSPPVITTAGSTPALLNIQDSASTVSNFAFQLPSGGTGDGLEFGGSSATGITVTGQAGDDGTGVRLDSEAAMLSDATVTLPSSAQTVGILVLGDDDVITGADVAAGLGIQLEAPSATISRLQSVAPIGVRDYDEDGETVEDSLILVQGTSGFAKYGVQSQGAGSSMTLLSDTILNTASGDIGAGATGTGAITMRDSIVRGFPEDLESLDAGSTLTSDYNDYATQTANSGAAPIGVGAHDVDVDPDFVLGSGGGDYHLESGSPLIDKGEPGPLASGESTVDYYGADRLVAGHGGCTFVRDIGAAEYQSLTPTAAASASAPKAVAGSPVGFDGTKSCGPGALSPIASYSWSFGDGSSASGATVKHAFAAAGAHTVTLTVTTAPGHSATATVTVQVSAKPASIARVTRLSVSPHRFATTARHRRKPGATVAYTLNESASVMFTVEHLTRGRRGAHGTCAAPSRLNRKSAKCTRVRVVRGSITKAGRAGTNRFHFAGRLRGHALAHGSYLLVATPSLVRHRGRAASIRFTVIG